MRKILKHLGYPLYPVGVADESVGPLEVRKLRELIYVGIGYPGGDRR
jgi:hypothetical protein